MAGPKQSKGRGGKLTRSETVTVRLDPKLRYLAELAALKQRRTLSSFIEWVIEDSLTRLHLADRVDQYTPCVTDEARELWDVDEPDRFVKLALRYPSLLNHEEQKLWKIICENGYLWRGKRDQYTGEWKWVVRETDFIFERLRNNWQLFQAALDDQFGPGILPTWDEEAPAADKTTAEP